MCTTLTFESVPRGAPHGVQQPREMPLVSCGREHTKTLLVDDTMTLVEGLLMFRYGSTRRNRVAIVDKGSTWYVCRRLHTTPRMTPQQSDSDRAMELVFVSIVRRNNNS